MLANDAAESWKDHYGTRKSDIYAGIIKLGKNPNPDDVDKAIGNKSWTITVCNECGTKNVDVVEVGEELYDDCAPTHLCRDCVQKVLACFVVTSEESSPKEGTAHG